MHLNTDPVAPAPPPRKPCLRDLHELVTRHLPEPVVKLCALDELRRRVAEINAEYPQYREETPIVVQQEMRRRARFQGLLRASHRPAPEASTAQPACSRA